MLMAFFSFELNLEWAVQREAEAKAPLPREHGRFAGGMTANPYQGTWFGRGSFEAYWVGIQRRLSRRVLDGF
jgi:hypothetical protein